MNTLKHYLPVLTTLLIGCLWLAGCAEEKGEAAAAAQQEQTYTCPMHPQVVKNGPGDCPICGMDLVPFDKNNTDNFLTLGASQQALASISVITLGEERFSNFTRLNGRIVVDPNHTRYIASRVAGRIEQLFVKETGVRVRQGQPLYKIYSEELSTLQQEYLALNAQAQGFPDDRRFQQLAQAAKHKLLLYGQSEKQLQELIRLQRTDPFISYTAPFSGAVAELSITEGQYVGEGSPIMKLESYEKLWIEADLYPAEAKQVRAGQSVQLVVAGYEDQPQTMKIDFISPALSAGNQVMQIRGAIANPRLQWQPGLQAIVLLPSFQKENSLSLPVDAVIRSGRGAHVWVETAPGKYEPRKVTTGVETADRVEIRSGLEEGEKLVVAGAYLLYSEYVLKKGKDPIAERRH